jgi:hypothetical protein
VPPHEVSIVLALVREKLQPALGVTAVARALLRYLADNPTHASGLEAGLAALETVCVTPSEAHVDEALFYAELHLSCYLMGVVTNLAKTRAEARSHSERAELYAAHCRLLLLSASVAPLTTLRSEELTRLLRLLWLEVRGDPAGGVRGVRGL